MLPALHPPEGGTMGHKTLKHRRPNHRRLLFSLLSAPKVVLFSFLKNHHDDVYDFENRDNILKSTLNSNTQYLQGTFSENSTVLGA